MGGRCRQFGGLTRTGPVGFDWRVAKKKKDRIVADGRDDKPFNNPFGALAALKADLPDAPAPAPEPTPEPEKPSGPRGKVVITREKKGRGGKTVTRVARLGLAPADLEATLDTLKRTLGCAGSIEEGDLILSGDQTNRAADWVKATLGRKVVVGN